MKHFHLHLVSDSTGETVSSVARAAVAQFEDIDAQEHIWTLIRTPSQLEKILVAIDQSPGVVMYTLVKREMRDALKQFRHQRNLPCIPVLARPVLELASYLGVESSSQPGRQHAINEQYFSRVEAINYALAHDDGQATWELEEADVVVLGVSRTSKSPTCVYLANRGYKAANIPLVPDCPVPEHLFELKRPAIVGLTIDPERLLQIRHSRMQSLKQADDETSYVERDCVLKELSEARKLFNRHGWPTIDVTRRSVEETAATIIQHIQRHQEKRRGSA